MYVLVQGKRSKETVTEGTGFGVSFKTVGTFVKKNTSFFPEIKKFLKIKLTGNTACSI